MWTMTSFALVSMIPEVSTNFRNNWVGADPGDETLGVVVWPNLGQQEARCGAPVSVRLEVHVPVARHCIGNLGEKERDLVHLSGS